MNYDRYINQAIAAVPPSGIRRFFDIAATMKDAISLGVGEPDFVTPYHIRNAAINSIIDGGTQYTGNRGLPELCREISEYLSERFHTDYDPKTEIMVTVGASEAIDIALRALVGPGDEVLVPQPSYVSYSPSVIFAGGTPVGVETTADTEFRLTPEALRAAITPRTKCLILPYPNNPTGALYPKEVLQQIVDIAREHQLIIFSDEIYDRLVMDGLQHISIASMAPDLFCVTFSGLSKSHMIAGYRIGWMILSGNKRIAKDYIEGLNMLANMRMCSNVPAQSVVQTALGGHQSVNDYIVPGGRVHDQRDLVYDMLNQIPGITAVKPKAAFYIFPKIDVKRFNIHSDEQFALDLLHDKHILISHGGAFNWHRPDHFRVVYLPRMGMLRETMGEISDFFSYYWQS